MISRVTVQHDQTIYDIALQEYGELSAIYSLMEDNSQLSLDTDMVEGDVLLIDSTKVVDQSIVNAFRGRELKPAHRGGDDPLVGGFSDGFSDGFET